MSVQFINSWQMGDQASCTRMQWLV